MKLALKVLAVSATLMVMNGCVVYGRRPVARGPVVSRTVVYNRTTDPQVVHVEHDHNVHVTVEAHQDDDQHAVRHHSPGPPDHAPAWGRRAREDGEHPGRWSRGDARRGDDDDARNGDDDDGRDEGKADDDDGDGDNHPDPGDDDDHDDNGRGHGKDKDTGKDNGRGKGKGKGKD